MSKCHADATSPIGFLVIMHHDHFPVYQVCDCELMLLLLLSFGRSYGNEEEKLAEDQLEGGIVKPGAHSQLAHVPGLLKLFSEKCVCVCLYVYLYVFLQLREQNFISQQPVYEK